MLARAIQHETDHLDGIIFVDRLDREARKEAMRFIREAEWFGDAEAAGQGLPARHQRPRASDGPCGSSSPAPPRSPCPRSRRSPTSRHELVGVVTRPDAPAGPGTQAGRRHRWRSGPRSSAYPCSSPTTPATPTSRRRCARSSPRLLPGRRLRRAAAAVGARHPGARLGQPALLGAAGLARRGPRAARDLGRRRGDRRDHVPDRQGARRRADLRADDADRPARRHRRRPARAARRGRRRPAGADPRRHRGRHPGGARAARRRASASRPKITVEDARVDWTEPAIAVDRRIRACTPAPRRLVDLGGERIKLGPVRPVGRERLEPGVLEVTKNDVFVGTATGPVRLGRVRRSARRRWTPPTGPVA